MAPSLLDPSGFPNCPARGAREKALIRDLDSLLPKELVPLLMPMHGEAVHAGTDTARTCLGSFRHSDRYCRTPTQGVAPGELYLDE